MNSGTWRGWLPLAMLFLALQCPAQDYDDADDDMYPGAGATMSLAFENRGAVSVDLTLPTAPASWDSLRSTLAQALDCSADSLRNPQTSAQEAASTRNGWTAAQRDRYLKQLATFDQRSLRGHCPSALAYREGVSQGDIDLAPFANEVSRMGIQQLQVYVSLPRAQYLEHSHAYLLHEPIRGVPYFFYQIPLAAGSKPEALHFAYGLRRTDVDRAFYVLAAFIVLPLALVLWMRHTALTKGETDPTAAWFGFFRTLNWLLTASMLLWITSGLGARQTLQDWVANLALPAWQSVPADISVMLGPGFLVYLLCTAVSYPVYAQMRSTGWSRREFLQQQLVTIGAQALPLMLFLAGLQSFRHVELAAGLLILAYVMLLVFRHLKLKVTKTFPQALTTGELHDRVFALAARMGVKVNQVFVLPAGKAQVANAYASAKNVVMFTDYLLEHLTKREVDAVAAHELAHLEHKHPGKRALAFFAALFLPSYFPSISGLLMAVSGVPLGLLGLGTPVAAHLVSGLYQAMLAFDQWQQRDFVLIMLGLTGFYFLSRRFENQADRTAVRITSDPEAQISGLLKLNRLNMTPIQFGKVSEGWLTHPSSVRRAERIATAGGMPPERLREILDRYAAEGHRKTAVPSVGEGQEDYYAVPAVSNPDTISLAARDNVRSQVKIWLLRAAHVIPPALFALLIRKTSLHGTYALAAYVAGLVITMVFLVLLGARLGTVGRSNDKRQLLKRFSRERVPVGRPEDLFVGFAPSPYPRLYGSRYHWDTGFLVLARDRLQFVGTRTRFSLSAGQIEGIALGQGSPSWWKVRRPYIRWKPGPTESSTVFGFYLLEPCSMWKTRAQALELLHRLQQCQNPTQPLPVVRPQLADLQAPSLGDITCLSPEKLGGFRTILRVLLGLLPLTVGVGILMQVNLGYMCMTAIALRLFESIPFWRYRDTLPQFAPASPGNDGSAKVRAASANSEAS